jgi:dephospho-CoA kinase
MLKVGLTGGIGSGKTTVARIFELLGIPVYYADQEAKRLMNADAGIKNKVIEHFGESSYKDNVLDRAYLATIVFNNKKKLELLNSFVHPATIAHSEEWMKLQQAPYAIREAALIFESHVNKQLDYVIGVSSPRLLRIQRVTSRDMIQAEEVESRMNNQMDEDKKISLCDFVIRNDEQELVIPQVLSLHKKLVQLAKTPEHERRNLTPL